VVVWVGGAGVGAGAAATGEEAAGVTALAVPAPDPDVGVVGCPTPPLEEAASAAALVAAADAASAASVRWSALITAESRARVRAFAAFWLVPAGVTLDVVVLVVETIVELTKALASPAPIKAIEVTATDGMMRRRARDRRSARAPVARLAAMRSLATSNSSGSIVSSRRLLEEFGGGSGLIVTTTSVRAVVAIAG